MGHITNDKCPLIACNQKKCFVGLITQIKILTRGIIKNRPYPFRKFALSEQKSLPSSYCIYNMQG